MAKKGRAGLWTCCARRSPRDQLAWMEQDPSLCHLTYPLACSPHTSLIVCQLHTHFIGEETEGPVT